MYLHEMCRCPDGPVLCSKRSGACCVLALSFAEVLLAWFRACKKKQAFVGSASSQQPDQSKSGAAPTGPKFLCAGCIAAVKSTHAILSKKITEEDAILVRSDEACIVLLRTHT